MACSSLKLKNLIGEIFETSTTSSTPAGGFGRLGIKPSDNEDSLNIGGRVGYSLDIFT
jgi:hypothetical protein